MELIGRTRWGSTTAVVTLGLLLLAAVAPGAASGAQTALQISGDGITYTADNGETNAMVVSQQGNNYRFVDPGGFDVVGDVGGGCAWVGPGEATCPTTGITRFSIGLADLNDTFAVDVSVGAPLQRITVFAGDGNDTVSVPPASTFDNGFQGGAGDDTLLGGAFEDDFSPGPGNDVMVGREGEDLFRSGPGDDTMDGGQGRDQFLAGSTPDGADSIDGGPDVDLIRYDSRSGDLALSLDGVANDGEAAEGDNLLRVENLSAGSGSDTIIGDAAPNSLNAGQGNNTVVGGAGNDSIGSDDGDDTLNGGAGNDSIFSGEGADTISGAEGDDTFFAFSDFRDDSVDRISGGPGLDTVDAGSLDAVRVSLDGVADDGLVSPPTPTPKDNVGSDVENVAGGSGDDTLIGNASPNELLGRGGNDTLIGGGGEDGLFGEAGNDTLDGGAGVDVLDGGAGSDTIRSRDASADEVNCGSATDTAIADALDQLAPSCDLISRGVVIAAGQAKAKGKRLNLKVSCPSVEPGGCQTSFKVRSAKKVAVGGKRKRITIAKGTQTIAAGKGATARLKLTKSARRALSRSKRIAAIATATMNDSGGVKLRSERKIEVVA
jgi:Ca2+-binding RTX toxin-like protein